VDGLTFLNNQAAYIKNKKELDKNIKNGISFTIVVFDICDIKKINENYGDDTGNMAILDAANLMKSVFCPDNIYRYNNNQFVGIFYNISEDDLKILFSKFEEKIDLLNKTPNLYKVPLVISKGYAIYNANIDNDCNDTFNRAKIEMYNDK
ncbi:MAG: GGDEF domain-containing protein, partial [Desulfovibrio sp.]|nr:GGDEF domain-containing protein [Desulfovibrio sp.]